MPIDNLFLDDLTVATPDDLAQAVATLARSGVEEKFRLDFKETWMPDKQWALPDHLSRLRRPPPGFQVAISDLCWRMSWDTATGA